jgi:hypothetical protein
MISVALRKPAKRKKPTQVNFWADDDLVQIIRDLKTACPKLKKQEIFALALKDMHKRYFR